jgi:signal transduction histidine kinase
MMKRPLRLLLVEDMEDHALLLVRELGKGFEVAFDRVDTLQELEAALDVNPWDAVIADFHLPAFDGLDALRMMQAKGLDLPFILVSGVIGEEMAVEAMKAGAHDFILKGKYSRLVPALERELREAASRRERRKAEVELTRYREHLEELVRERTAELEKAKFEAEAANRAKSEFLTNMSHEMRTPLTGVVGVIDLLLNEKLDEEDCRSLLEMAGKAAGSLNRLISDVLDFSRLAAGKMSFVIKSFDLGGCVRSAADILALEAGRKGLGFHLEIDDDVPARVVADEGRLRQVLVNLVGNAVKFTQRGEVRVSVRRAHDPARPGEEVLMFAVRDTGIGIPANQMGRIFDRFTQLDTSSSERYGGCGLGLAISKQIVENLGGEIRAESRQGEGSVFTFTIALAEANTNSRRKEQDAGRTSGDATGSAARARWPERPSAQAAYVFMASAFAQRAALKELAARDETADPEPPPGWLGIMSGEPAEARPRLVH